MGWSKRIVLPEHGWRELAPAMVAEFIGTMIFQLLGGISDPNAPQSGAFINGMALMVLVYATASVSGGHLNPAISFMAFVIGKQPLLATLAYTFSQYLGAITGSLLALGLVPGAQYKSGNGPGCFQPSGLITSSQVFGWECIMTGTLAFVVASTAMSKRNMGGHAPLAIGFTLFVSASAIGQYSGSFLNPARVVGPEAVFLCNRGKVLSVEAVYVFSEYSGGILGGLFYLVTHKMAIAMGEHKGIAGKELWKKVGEDMVPVEDDEEMLGGELELAKA